MTARTVRVVVFSASFIALIGCEGERGSPQDSAGKQGALPSAAAPAASTVAPRDTTGSANQTGVAGAKAACASEGEWQQCSVEKRLTDAGFVPVAKGAAARGVFDIPGTQYALGPADLHVYIFPSAREREAAVAMIDTVTVARRSGASPWSMPPTFITSNNLVAVLLSDNGRLIERVQLAITAGLPSAAH